MDYSIQQAPHMFETDLTVIFYNTEDNIENIGTIKQTATGYEGTTIKDKKATLSEFALCLDFLIREHTKRSRATIGKPADKNQESLFN